MRVSAGVVWIGLGVLVGGQAPAAENANAAETDPDIELLEYLGGLVQEQGQWVGPDDMKSSPDERAPPIVRDDDDEE
jgi:hypothetical protein